MSGRAETSGVTARTVDGPRMMRAPWDSPQNGHFRDLTVAPKATHLAPHVTHFFPASEKTSPGCGILSLAGTLITPRLVWPLCCIITSLGVGGGKVGTH